MNLPTPSVLWKVATVGASLLAALMVALLFSSYLQNRDLTSQRAALQKSIDDPRTGFVVQLAQARTNVAQLQQVVETQNAAYDKLSTESRRALADAEQRLAAAQARTRVLEAKVAGFLATKPQGATLSEQIEDIDERAMKEFLP